MNLELLTSKLKNVANLIAENNSEHFNINNSLYDPNDTLSDICGKDDKGTCEKGILIELQEVLHYFEYLAGQQQENIRKTSRIVYKLEEASQCVSASKY